MGRDRLYNVTTGEIVAVTESADMPSMKVTDVAGARELADEIKAKLIALQGPGDTEAQHGEADGLLCEMLERLGFADVVAAFGKVNKWYA